MDWNLVLNIAALVALATGAIKVGGTKRLRETVADYKSAVEAKDVRIDQLEKGMGDLSSRAAKAEDVAHEAAKEAAAMKARYEELSKYAARDAVEHFEQLFREHRESVAVRHELMIERLESVAEGQRAHGELLLKLLELASR